jgi:hypothetical protein
VAVTLFLKDPRTEFKSHIDAPVEAQLAEEQKRGKVIHLEDVNDARDDA